VFLLLGLMQTGISLFIPEAAKELGMNSSQISWALFLPNFINAALLLPCSMLLDCFHEKKIFSLFIFLFFIGSLFCFFAYEFSYFFVGRLLQGIGMAVGMPGSYLIIKRYSQSIIQSHQTVFNTFMTVTSFFLIVNTFISGAMSAWFGWRWVFGLMSAIGMLILLLMLPRMPQQSSSKKFHFSNILFCSYIIAPSIACVSLIRYGLNIYSILVLCVSVAILWCGIKVNLNRCALNHTKVGKIALCLLNIFAIQSILSTSNLTVLACREVLGLTPQNSGLILFYSMSIGIFTPLLSNKICSFMKEKTFLLISSCLIAFSQLLIIASGYFINLEAMIIGRVFFAAVSTLLLTKCMWILLNEFDKSNEGFMSGVIQQTRYISGAICLAFSSAIVFKNTAPENAILSSSKFTLAMCCPFAICVLPLLYATFKIFEEKRLEKATKISLNN